MGAADGAEGPEEDSGSRSNKELENEAESQRTTFNSPPSCAEANSFTFVVLLAPG